MKFTMPMLFEESVKKYPSNILVMEKQNGKYVGTTYKEMQTLIHNFAGGLLKLGFQKGDRVALISEGRNDWVMSELGIVFIGAINVPISVKIEELNDLKFRLAHSGCKYIIVSKRQLEKIRKIEIDLPELDKIIVLDEIEIKSNEITRNKVLELGEEYLRTNKEIFTNIWQSLSNDDYANICYTSGTTADPKGIILTHRNYTANIEQANAVIPVPEYYSSLLILPWDHSFAHTVGIYFLMKNGASMSSVEVGNTPLETLKNIPKNIKETKPVFLLSVPALAKNFKKNIENGIKAKGPKVEALFNKALKMAYEYNNDGFKKGKGLNKLKIPMLKLYDKILFSKIRAGFGGKLEFFFGGGALLDIELQKFFYAIGIPMLQGYGLSEAAPIISANVPKLHKMGSSGRIIKDLEVKIVDSDDKELPQGEQGEIICKGENVMAGYWKNEKATSETLKDGWLYTGDMGYFDSDGFLYVLGRFKSLLIGSDGEKFSPEGIEEALVDQSKYIDQVMLYNNQSPYTVALLFPNKAALLQEVKDKGFSINSEEARNEITNILQSEINNYKKGGKFEGMFPERWLPAAIGILGEGFTEQNQFLNTTLKMVRGKITDFYITRLEFLFTSEGKVINNQQNNHILSHWHSEE
ncbi:MAG: AMP-binding protein [Ignavibacteriae bacterium]|nr:AMP-binding protein [Ignavibacteriota bacterium]